MAHWLEAGLIRAIYVAKIRRAAGTDDPHTIHSWSDIDGEHPRSYIGKPNPEIVGAFLGHYLWIWLFFGLFILIIPNSEDIPLEPASPFVVTLVVAVPIVSHLFSYWQEYLGDREYERRGPVSLLVEPGPRFLSLFFAVFVGAATASLTENPFGVIAVLIFFRTCADLLEHRRECKRALQTLEN